MEQKSSVYERNVPLEGGGESGSSYPGRTVSSDEFAEMILSGLDAIWETAKSACSSVVSTITTFEHPWCGQ